MTNVVVMYHDNCTDGFCSAWLMSQCFPDALFLPQGNIRKTLAAPDIKDKNIYIVDYCFPYNNLKFMAEHAQHVTVLDHHVTMMDDYVKARNDGFINGDFDINKSGAMLTYEWLTNELGYSLRTGCLVKYVQDYDLYRFALPASRDVNAAIRSYPKTFDSWNRLLLNEHLALEGEHINRYRDQVIREHLKTVAPKKLPGFEHYNSKYVYCSSIELISDLGHAVAETCDFAIVRHHEQYSLRSIDMDVSVIAKHFGGGGHRNAAGFQASDLKR